MIITADAASLKLNLSMSYSPPCPSREQSMDQRSTRHLTTSQYQVVRA